MVRVLTRYCSILSTLHSMRSCEACVMVRVLTRYCSILSNPHMVLAVSVLASKLPTPSLPCVKNMVMLKVKVMTNSKVRLPSRKMLE